MAYKTPNPEVLASLDAFMDWVEAQSEEHKKEALSLTMALMKLGLTEVVACNAVYQMFETGGVELVRQFKMFNKPTIH